jgi:hypothetical protein
MKTKLTFKKSITAASYAAISAAVVNAILFIIFHALNVFTDEIEIKPGQSLTILPVLISSIMPTLIPGFVFFLFEKYTMNGFRNFSILAIVLLLLSFLNPFLMIPNVTFLYGVVLNVMHVVVVLALLYFLKRAYQSK